MLSVYEVDPLFFWLYWGGLGVLLTAVVVLTIKWWGDVKGLLFLVMLALAAASVASILIDRGQG